MCPKIRVIHFGAQCPWYQWVIEQAKQANESVGGTLEVIDVTNNERVASKYRLFSPFMTIINDAVRIPSPMLVEQIVEVIRKRPNSRRAHDDEWMDQKIADRIEPLQSGNLKEACSLCIEVDSKHGGNRYVDKQTWYSQQVASGHFGLIAYKKEKVVGAVEYLPSNLVPYPIPDKTKDKAFITCLYSMSHGQGEYIYDCRGHLLEELVKHLVGRYQKIQVIAGRRAAYPNGPSGLFEKYGFRIREKVDDVVMRVGHDEWLLMERDLVI